MLIKNKSKLLLVILLCICLSSMVLGQNRTPTEQVANQVSLVKNPTTHNQPERKAADSGFGFGQEDPMLLLLVGLAAFVAATTLRRKRSRSDAQTTTGV